jgi:hypothetical protein
MCVSERNLRANASTFPFAIMNRIRSMCFNHMSSMGTMTLDHVSKGDRQEWKTQEYHGKHIHVCTVQRINENHELSGHGQQWDFKVRITDNGAGPTAHECASGESDPESFYSSQSVAEDLAFIRGRELVEGM